MGFFHRNCARKQNVVFQVDVPVQIGFECREPAVKGLEADAGIRRGGIAAADLAHAAGKGVSMSEFWLHKSTTLVGFAEGADSLVDIRARDMFSFWTPLDEQFLRMIGKLANYKRFDYISGFGFYYWFALTDFNSLPSPPVFPPANSTQNATIDAFITNTQNQLAKQALAKQQFSPTGNAYKILIASIPTR